MSHPLHARLSVSSPDHTGVHRQMMRPLMAVCKGIREAPPTVPLLCNHPRCRTSSVRRFPSSSRASSTSTGSASSGPLSSAEVSSSSSSSSSRTSRTSSDRPPRPGRSTPTGPSGASTSAANFSTASWSWREDHHSPRASTRS
ncbi:hypothetical protein FA10DRAFT_495 [Acaromyces ingoldii]|uniref:Uncharacterized protein n=1 Tax=Acaromyces ingoldii TaxID=215250 RepID=A0A316YSV1_9BASI|nr:hypothetical protein FA10DRAFT_495 [Acaromyces ingoldii]PWN92630.1 hypothetical protein FA10DRAFT_495 [Acaromyces ingoldii]